MNNLNAYFHFIQWNDSNPPKGLNWYMNWEQAIPHMDWAPQLKYLGTVQLTRCWDCGVLYEMGDLLTPRRPLREDSLPPNSREPCSCPCIFSILSLNSEAWICWISFESSLRFNHSSLAALYLSPCIPFTLESLGKMFFDPDTRRIRGIKTLDNVLEETEEDLNVSW